MHVQILYVQSFDYEGKLSVKKENIISIHDKEKEKEKIWYTIISHIVKVTNTYDGKLYHDGKEVTK